ncbi:MAG: outer membrane lipoprotein-sorting protein [Candidatus Hydrogenedentota bacterium]|nr:MAG: outer membrane lipoprotein-sorting protein [Candidatus Hydrogenedentota bacterium]
MLRIFVWPLMGLLLLTAGTVAAETSEEKGLAIAQEADRRDEGFGDFTAALTMELKNKHGKTSTRNLRIKTLEQVGDGDKSLTIFDEPADVKGTALLTFSHKTGDDDQWLYLPALKRVKRIASNNQAGPFMGSEFSYEDFSSQEVEKYTYKYLRDETLDGIDCFVIERYPVHPKSGYTRQVAWFDKAEYRAQKVVYYDRKDALLKTFLVRDWKLYRDKHWRAHTMLMENHQSGKSTRLSWNAFQFKTGLSERDFNKNSLARVR